ncbi:MAG: UvrY/SirA/GacA family response regulator transcription factor [Proteobacteria bacterium]|nr:UvrY/SirA/GacA family response regulator transcription factor [Pseudomonadota bacterium]
MIRVLIVDDHAIVRVGIKRLLQDVPGIRVIADLCSGEETLSFIRKDQPDVILLDVRMPGIGGLETTRRISKLYPDIKILAVTAFNDNPYPSMVLQAGAAGFLTKDSGVDEMIDAIKKVFKGERYISPEIAQQLALKSIGETSAPTPTSPLEGLSEREIQVMLMLTNGTDIQDIADKLSLSTKTINSYRYRIFEKLGVKNDVELTYYAMRHGYIDKLNYAQTEE